MLSGVQGGLFCRRSPLGLRGLKCLFENVPNVSFLSQPSWAAWIEISDAGKIIEVS